MMGHSPDIQVECRLRRVAVYFSLLVAAGFCFFSLPRTVSAAPLGEARSGPLSITLEIVKPQLYRLTARVSSKRPITPKVFAIENPVRLVIDLPGQFGKGNQNQSVDDEDVAAFRVGVHPDKTRIVVDLKGSSVPKFQASSRHQDPGTLHIDFSVGAATLPAEESEADFSDENWIEPEAEVPPPTAVPQATPSSASVSEKNIVDEPTQEKDLRKTEPVSVPTSHPEEQPTPATSPEPNAAAGTSAQAGTPGQESAPFAGSTINTIYYQTLENTRVPAVAFETSKTVSYSLNQIKSDLYELTIDNSRLGGKHLSLPQFPPDTFRGFQVVVAREEKGKVLVRVYVEEGAKLFPFLAKGNLWVKVSGIKNP